MITVSFVFTRNKGTDSIKTLLNTLLPEEELAGLWKQRLYSKNPHVAMTRPTCGRRRDGPADQDRHLGDPDASRKSIMNVSRVDVLSYPVKVDSPSFG